MGETCFRVNAPTVIHESIDGEVIVINPRLVGRSRARMAQRRSAPSDP